MPPTRSTTTRSGSATPTCTTRPSPSGTSTATPTRSTCARRSRRCSRPTQVPGDAAVHRHRHRVGWRDQPARLSRPPRRSCCGPPRRSSAARTSPVSASWASWRRSPAGPAAACTPRATRPRTCPPTCGMVLKLTGTELRAGVPGGAGHARLQPGLRAAGHRPAARAGEPRRQPAVAAPVASGTPRQWGRPRPAPRPGGGQSSNDQGPLPPMRSTSIITVTAVADRLRLSWWSARPT